MNEEFLQFVWKNQLYSNSLYTKENRKIEVIDAGKLNSNSGPDFLNAKIKLGNTI